MWTITAGSRCLQRSRAAKPEEIYTLPIHKKCDERGISEKKNLAWAHTQKRK